MYFFYYTARNQLLSFLQYQCSHHIKYALNQINTGKFYMLLVLTWYYITSFGVLNLQVSEFCLSFRSKCVWWRVSSCWVSWVGWYASSHKHDDSLDDINLVQISFRPYTCYVYLWIVLVARQCAVWGISHCSVKAGDIISAWKDLWTRNDILQHQLPNLFSNSDLII